VDSAPLVNTEEELEHQEVLRRIVDEASECAAEIPFSTRLLALPCVSVRSAHIVVLPAIETPTGG
jgi:hypothetical protein